MKLSYLFLFSFLTLVSCTKDKRYIPEDHGCINRVIVSEHDYSVSVYDYEYAAQLFHRNNISQAGLRFTRLEKDTFSTGAFVNIRSQQYINGLPVFVRVIDYGFKNEQYDYLYGELATTGLDATPRLNLALVRRLYIERAKAGGYNFSNICLNAEFGYYDVNIGTGTNAISLVKAWKVNPQDSEWPVAYIDDNGVVIVFDSGVIIF
jgi:hypothetical protein